MIKLILKRLLQLPVILGVIFLITFTLVWLIPGDPLERPEGQRPPPEIAEAMRRQYNLHSPTAFVTGYLKGVLLHGDFGPSLTYRDQRVSDILATALPVSATLGIAALVVALFVGLIAGMIGAVRPGSVLDLSSLIVALIGVSLPTFVTGSVLIALGALLFDFVKIGPWEWPGWEFWYADFYTKLADMLVRLILPALTLGAAPAAYIARLIRLGLADVLASDYIRTAQAKGLPGHTILFKHALKVAFLPVLSFLGPAAAAAMTGSFVVEQVFSIKGMGEHFVDAVLNKDQFLVLGVVLVYSTILVVFNLAVDVAYAWVDPRIELD